MALIVLGLGWPLSMSPAMRSENLKLFVIWTVSTLSTSLFLLFPVEVTENLPLLASGGVVLLLTGVIGIFVLRRLDHDDVGLLWAQIGLCLLAVYVVLDQGVRRANKEGLGVVNMWLSWGILCK